MTNTEGTLVLRKTEEQAEQFFTEGGESISITTLSDEADGIRAITDLIYYKCMDMNLKPSPEEQQEMYNAVFGLKTLIGAHAAHARQLLDLAELKEVDPDIR